MNFCCSKGKNMAYASNAVYHHFDWREEASNLEHLWNIYIYIYFQNVSTQISCWELCSLRYVFYLLGIREDQIHPNTTYLCWILKNHTSSFKFTKNHLLLASWSLGSVCVFDVSFPNALLFALLCLLFPQCKGGYIASFGSSARRIFRSTDERQDLQHLSVITLWWHGIVKYYLSKKNKNA